MRLKNKVTESVKMRGIWNLSSIDILQRGRPIESKSQTIGVGLTRKRKKSLLKMIFNENS